MMNSIYKVLTPAGQFDAIFAEEEDIPIEYSGDELAITFFKNWLFINQISGEHGHLLDSQNLTPSELYGFCQPRGGVIEVIPLLEDLLAYIQEDAANPVEDNDEQPQEENTMQANDMVTDNSLDGVYTDADKEAIAATNQLIKYFRDFIASDFEKAKVPTSIYGWTATGQVMNKDEAKRMLRSMIDVAINRKAGIEDITPKQKQRLIDYQHDARVISDYLTNRIRHTGVRNLLRTPEMKAKFPEIDNQPRDEFDSAAVRDEVKNIVDATLDNISGIEKIKLIKEAGSLRSSLQTAQSGMEKLKMVKRIKEIRDALGVGGGDGLDKDGLDADGMWPMTRAEYDKIHSDYKGAFPDGAPTALKLINGATSIVPVRITDEQPKDPEPEVKPQATIEDVNKVMPLLKQFIGAAQLSAIGSVIRGEEGQFFKDKLIEIANVIRTMPKTYGQDGMGDKAIAYLHYFKGSGDWHITEKDMEDEQLQAFGLANLGQGGELGYISIQELIDAGVELDLYWTPKTIGAIKGVSSEDESQGTETGGDETSGESTEIPQSPEVPQTIAPADAIKVGFIAELESLKSETDINRFNERLDEIAARIEQAGLMETLDKELNDAADVLTALLAAAEKVS